MSYKKSEKLYIQPRDMDIFKFLDRIGYANVRHVTSWLGLSGEKSEAAVLRRLYLLRRFGYIKTFSSMSGNYYALDRLGAGNNALIRAIKLEQLPHHDFLVELFLVVKDEEVLTEREAIAQFKVVGRKGRIPDMIINDWVIEYERTNKSVADTKAVVDYWTVEQAKNLCVIYESEQIKNRYGELVNQRVKLVAKDEFANILSHLMQSNTIINVSLENIKDKYK